MVETGQVLVTRGGRQITAPVITLGTERKVLATLKRIDAWLVNEAILEVAGTDVIVPKLSTRGLLTDADRALCNFILFDEP